MYLILCKAYEVGLDLKKFKNHNNHPHTNSHNGAGPSCLIFRHVLLINFTKTRSLYFDNSIPWAANVDLRPSKRYILRHPKRDPIKLQRIFPDINYKYINAKPQKVQTAKREVREAIKMQEIVWNFTKGGGGVPPTKPLYKKAGNYQNSLNEGGGTIW